MNGKTAIDETLNPCSAKVDRKTYGWRRLNACLYGSRIIKLTVGRLTLDVYRGGGKIFTATGGGANGSSRYWMLFTPAGKILWVTHWATR